MAITRPCEAKTIALAGGKGNARDKNMPRTVFGWAAVNALEHVMRYSRDELQEQHRQGLDWPEDVDLYALQAPHGSTITETLAERRMATFSISTLGSYISY